MASAALPGRTVTVLLVRSSQVSIASAGGDVAAIENDLKHVALEMVNSVTHDPRLDGALYVAPLTAADGHMIGAVGISDCSTGEEVASLVEDIIASLELDMWRRLPERDSSDWALSAVIDDINRSRTLDEVVTAFERHGGDAVGAEFVSVVQVDGAVIRLLNNDDGIPDLSTMWRHVNDWECRPLLAAIVDGEPQVLLDPPVDGIASYSAIPLFDSTGAARLVVGFGFSAGDDESGVPSAIRRLAAAAGYATRRVVDHEAAEDHAGVLAKVVLPDALPAHVNIDLYGQYVAPTRTQRVGGDVYDAWLRPDGTMGVFVADVAGHSLQSTQVAALLRHSAGVLSLQGEQPARILEKVNEYLQQSADPLLATCCYCVVDPLNQVVTIANAGHPQPRVLGADGLVTTAGPRSERLLGYGLPAYSESEIPFDRGDALVLFTDGLIEQRTSDLNRGELRLEDLLAGANAVSARGLAVRLLDSLDDEHEDDVVVVVARFRRVPQTFERRWTADDLVLATLRRELVLWLEEFVETSVADHDSVILVATELLANARHVVTGREVVELTCEVRDGELSMKVTNPGQRFGLTNTMPGAAAERNRGLPIVHALSTVTLETPAPGLVSVVARFNV